MLPQSSDVARPMPRPTAQVAPFVEVFGADLAVTFLLAFGGGELHLSANPREGSALVQLVGRDRAAALTERASWDRTVQRRVPLAKNWLVEMLAWQGHSMAHIVRTLRISERTARRLLKGRERK
jgi:hypothetical protein